MQPLADTILEHIGSMYTALGKSADALPYFLKSVKLQEDILGKFMNSCCVAWGCWFEHAFASLLCLCKEILRHFMLLVGDQSALLAGHLWWNIDYDSFWVLSLKHDYLVSCSDSCIREICNSNTTLFVVSCHICALVCWYMLFQVFVPFDMFVWHACCLVSEFAFIIFGIGIVHEMTLTAFRWVWKPFCMLY
jgi:hypothetical protein